MSSLIYDIMDSICKLAITSHRESIRTVCTQVSATDKPKHEVNLGNISEVLVHIGGNPTYFGTIIIKSTRLKVT